MPASGPADPIAILYRQAEAHHRAGQFAETEALLNRVLAAAPGHSDGLPLHSWDDSVLASVAAALPSLQTAPG